MTTTRRERCHWSCIGKPDGQHSSSCPRSFTPPKKRATGECNCGKVAQEMALLGCPAGHLPDCPSFYPLQPQPGDEPDALTRLTREVRALGEMIGSGGVDVLLALISEAREEQRKSVIKARNEGLLLAIDVAHRIETAASGYPERQKAAADIALLVAEGMETEP